MISTCRRDRRKNALHSKPKSFALELDVFGGNDWFAEEESDRNSEERVYSGEFTSIKINSYSHSLLLYQYRIETYLTIHQFLARTRNSIPVSEFSDYVLEITQEDERSISHLVREFSVKFCLLAILS